MPFFFLAVRLAECIDVTPGAETLTSPTIEETSSLSVIERRSATSRALASRSRPNISTACFADLPFLPVPGVSLTRNLYLTG